MKEVTTKVTIMVFWGLVIIAVGHYLGHNLQMGLVAMLIVNYANGIGI